MTSTPQTGQIIWRLGGKHSSFTLGPGTAHRLAARPARARERRVQHLRQRRLPDGAQPVARDRRQPRTAGQDRDARQPVHPPAAAPRRKPGQRAGAGERRLVRRLGAGPGLLRVQPHRPAAVRRALPAPATSPTATCASPGRARPLTRPAFAVSPRRRSGAGTVYASWNGATLVAALAGARRAPPHAA